MESRGLRNNNPFNIRYSTSNLWKGKVPDEKKLDRSFEEFISLPYGIRSGMLLLANYIRDGTNTVESIIHRFAPSIENNTEAYIDFICGFESDIHLKPDTVIGVASVFFFELCRRIMYYESGYLTTFEAVFNISESFNLFRS